MRQLKLFKMFISSTWIVMATGQTSQPWNERHLFCTDYFHIDGSSLLWSASHSLGRNPLRAVIPFDLIWFVAHRGKWWERLLSWPSRNKPYQIRHIGLSVLAHTMGINWSPNTTDKSMPSFSPLSSLANWTAPPFDQQSISSQWEEGCRLTDKRHRGEPGKRLGRGSPSESHWQQERKWCSPSIRHKHAQRWSRAAYY